MKNEICPNCNCEKVPEDSDWRHRLRGIAQMADSLRVSENMSLVQPCLTSLLRTLLSSERNADVAEEKHRLLINLISRLPLDNLEERTGQIITGLCRQGGCGANRVCKALMQHLPPAVIVLKLLSSEFMHAKSSRFRENALQMVMYALMTFPSTVFDMTTCVTNATYAAFNRKRRVRQAALDVLAILGQIATARTVLDVVQVVAAKRDDGDELIAAVKTRLARKQLPMVTADGTVQYAFRVPSPQGAADGILGGNTQLGADIEWITAGIGSVSLTSLKKRTSRSRSRSRPSFQCLGEQDANGEEASQCREAAHAVATTHSDEILHRGRYYQSPMELFGPTNSDTHVQNMQQVLGNSVPLPCGFNTKKVTGDYSGLMNRCLKAKSCSDSSTDGRSSDSTYTSSSGGGSVNNTVADAVDNDNANGISGRFTRQAINSRFPTMDRLDMHMRVHKPPAYYPGMGAYAHLQQQQYNMSATYPKLNYNLPAQPTQPTQPMRKRSQRQQQQPHAPQFHQQQPLQKANAVSQGSFQQSEIRHKEQNSNGNDTLDGTYTICSGVSGSHSDTIVPAISATGKSHQTHQAGHGAERNGRRFINVEKFKIQSTKPSQTNEVIILPAEPVAEEPNKQTPTSVQSLTYSQKSTNSAQSTVKSTADSLNTPTYRKHGAGGGEVDGKSNLPATVTSEIKYTERRGNDQIDSGGSPTKWITGSVVLQADDANDPTGEAITSSVEEELDHKDTADSSLRRNESVVSLQSKADSIKTVLDDTPPVLSRTQSSKSIVIEEDIEDGANTNSFLVVDEVVKQTVDTIMDEIPVSSSSKESSPAKGQLMNNDVHPRKCSSPFAADSRSQSRSRSPTIEEMKAFSRRNSMIKSMESLYDRAPLKPDSSLDNTTETSSQASLQLNTAIPIRPQHTPLKQKAKTAHFLRRSRRVSPVKQAIKMAPAEAFPQTLERYEKPREAMHLALNQLDSGNWQVNMEALVSLVRLIRYHPEYLEAQMHMVCIQLTRTVRNLRSQVARAACKATTELFATIPPKYLEQECDDLTGALLHRTADTNRFLRADATRALESVCDHLSITKTINLLIGKGVAHQNAVVRTTVAKMFHRLVERLGVEKVFALSRENRDKIFLTGANLLLEGSLETRSYAKSMFKMLSEYPSYNRLLVEIIPMRIYRNIEKTLKSIR